MNKMYLSFKSKIENISFARNVAQAFLLPLDVKLSFLNEVKTIVSEGITNAIIHGYQRDDSHEVKLEMTYDDEYIYISIIDSGIGISDVEEARKPLYTSIEGERSGLGFTIMEVFSDEFSVESEVGVGTSLYIVKKREDRLGQ